MQRYALSIGVNAQLIAAKIDLEESALEHAIVIGLQFLLKWGDRLLLKKGFNRDTWDSSTAKLRHKLSGMGETHSLVVTITTGDLISDCLNVVTDVRAHSYVRQVSVV